MILDQNLEIDELYFFAIALLDEHEEPMATRFSPGSVSTTCFDGGNLTGRESPPGQTIEPGR